MWLKGGQKAVEERGKVRGVTAHRRQPEDGACVCGRDARGSDARGVRPGGVSIRREHQSSLRSVFAFFLCRPFDRPFFRVLYTSHVLNTSCSTHASHKISRHDHPPAHHRIKRVVKHGGGGGGYAAVGGG